MRTFLGTSAPLPSLTRLRLTNAGHHCGEQDAVMMDGRANFEPFVEISERGRDLVALGLHVKTCPQTLRDITRVNLIGDNLVYLVIGCRCAGPNGVT